MYKLFKCLLHFYIWYYNMYHSLEKIQKICGNLFQSARKMLRWQTEDWFLSVTLNDLEILSNSFSLHISVPQNKNKSNISVICNLYFPFHSWEAVHYPDPYYIVIWWGSSIFWIISFTCTMWWHSQAQLGNDIFQLIKFIHSLVNLSWTKAVFHAWMVFHFNHLVISNFD